MQPVGRRKFAKTLGLLGLLSIGAEAYKEVQERIVYKQDELPTKELEAILEKKSVLQLQAVYGTPKPVQSWSQFNVAGFGEEYVEGTKQTVSVMLIPGPDGKLYVKENDIWRKI